MAEIIDDRSAIYNYQIRLMRELELEGKALLLSPEEISGATTLVKDVEIVNRLYENGYRDGINNLEKIKKLMENR